MNEIYSQMLSTYEQTTELQKRNAIFEVNQQVILAGLYNGVFFDVAAFYGVVFKGGTSLSKAYRITNRLSYRK